MIGPGSAHLGAQVSALLDGQLAPDETERAWTHVSSCPTCAAAVHREQWVKRRLGGLADSAPPSGLTAVLAGLPHGPEAAARGEGRWPAPVRRGVGSRVTAAAIGVGSLSAVMVVLGTGYLAEGTPAPPGPAASPGPGAPAGTLPVNAWVADLTADVPATGRGPAAQRLRHPWATMEP